ncbi:MAG: hypothetical protein U0169_21985 [Polyangiaceae bacterium]
MEKLARCTVCTWRGTMEEAALAKPVRPSDIPPPMQEVQEAYAERAEARAIFGEPKFPGCPTCGHHLVMLKRRPSFHPAM